MPIRGEPQEAFGAGTLEAEALSAEGVFEAQDGGVEAEPPKGIASRSVAPVPCNGMSGVGELGSYLVLSAGLEPKLDEGISR
ncbi:MAG TPA: hypothetical protein VIO60_11500, partial [Rectinemataceae bacterium]